VSWFSYKIQVFPIPNNQVKTGSQNLAPDSTLNVQLTLQITDIWHKIKISSFWCHWVAIFNLTLC